MSPNAHGTGARETHGIIFWLSFAVGVGVMVQFGLRGAWHDLASTPARLSLGKWVIGADLANDLFILPVVCLVASLTALIPRLWRQPVQFGAFASAVVLFVVQNAVRGTGHFRHNPTIQPLDYTTATLTALAVVWIVVVTWAGTRVVRVHRSQRTRHVPVQ